jgi:hypothetical protein
MHISFQSYDTQTDCIVRVCPDDGQVVGWIFLHELKYAPLIKKAVFFQLSYLRRL